MNRKYYYILLIQPSFVNKYQFITVFRVIKWAFLIVLMGLSVAGFTVPKTVGTAPTLDLGSFQG